VLGRRSSEAGPLGPAYARGEETGRQPGMLAGRKRCWASGARKREGEGEKRISFFKKNSFQIHFSNIQTSIKQKSMHSNHDAQTLIISKLF
jgi:hypothetical protein